MALAKNYRPWARLVGLVDSEGNAASVDEIAMLLQLDRNNQEVEAVAARSNVTAIVRMLHDKSSQLMNY